MTISMPQNKIDFYRQNKFFGNIFLILSNGKWTKNSVCAGRSTNTDRNTFTTFDQIIGKTEKAKGYIIKFVSFICIM